MGNAGASKISAFLLVFVAGVASKEGSSQTRVPEPIVCAPEDTTSATRFEAAAATAPSSFQDLIALASCYDTAWRFADAERVILKLIDLAETAAAAAPPRTGLPIGGDGHIRAPNLVRMGRLDYPARAVDAGVRGMVVVQTRVDRSGRLRDVRVVGSNPWFDIAALDAVRQSQAERPMVAGKNEEILQHFFVRFGLPAEPMPADWLERARFYAALGLHSHARPALEAALARTRKDVTRFGPRGYVPGRTIESTSVPTKTRHVPPGYPQYAQARAIQGIVMLEGLVDAFGDMGRVRVVKSVPMLDAAAVDAVLGWGYLPLVVDGQPRPAVITVTVTFTLK